MTDYRTIRGKKVKFFETDLSGGEVEGQLFFSDTSKEMKIAVSSAAWHSEAPIISGRTVAQGATGTATAGLICFGNPGDAPYTLNETEEYNGSSWAIGGDTTHAASNATAAGTQTAAIAIGISSDPTTLTIKYDGTSWTDSGHAFPSTGGAGVGSGTQTATLYSGQGSGTNSYEYDGSSWTSGGTMATSRVGEGTGWGPQTSALMCTGRGPSTALTSATEEYNGTSWTSTNNVNAARRRLSASQNSTSQDSGIIFGGSPTSNPNAGTTVNTEQYDGSSWTEITNLSTARNHAGGAGSSTSAWVAGSNPNSALTEEFNITALTVTAGAFSSGTNNPQTATFGGYAGTQTAALMMGGQPNPTVKTIEYNGSAFSDGGDLPSLAHYNAAGFGTQTAGAICGGITHPGGPTGYGPLKTTLEYDGSSWSEGGALSVEKYLHGAAGTQTAGLAFAGHVTPNVPALQDTSEEYNGSSWTTGGDMNTARRNVAGTGTQTAALACAGYSPGSSPDFPLANESYNGSSWTSNPNQNFIRSNAVASGPYSSAISVAGASPAPAALDQTLDQWNGTIWSTGPAMAARRYQPGHGGGGMGTSLLISGGHTGSAYSNATEEFTPESTTLNLKTITDS